MYGVHLCNAGVLSGNDFVGRNEGGAFVESDVSLYYIHKNCCYGRDIATATAVFYMCLVFALVFPGWQRGVPQAAGSVYFLFIGRGRSSYGTYHAKRREYFRKIQYGK